MKSLFGQTVFTVAERAYRWEDVVLAAQLRGEWAALEQRTREGLACLKRAAAEGVKLDQGEAEAAANEFRYDRDLISGQEAADWLKRWGMSVGSWMDYFRRDLLRARWSEELAGTLDSFPVADDEVVACLKVEAVCSGRLDQFAEHLAGRAAAFERLCREPDGAGGEGGPASGPARAEFRADEWPGLSEDSFRQQAAHLARLEAEFDRYRRRLLTPRAVKEQLRARSLDWIRVTAQAASFPTEAAAREAALCVRADGMSLSEAAAEARRPVRQVSLYLDEVEPGLREVLLGVGGGGLSDPVKSGEEYLLISVLEKAVPSERDPEITRRAEEAILDGALEKDINRYVRWRHTPSRREGGADE
jgi:hypothetical protein